MKRPFNALIALLIICSASIAFAQEAQKNKIVSFSDFSGGLATKVSDQSSNPKYARIAENIRIGTSLNDLTKRSQLYLYGTADTSEAITGMHRLYLSDTTKYLLVTHGDELEVGSDSTGVFTTIFNLTYGNYRWQFLTWHDLAIGGDGHNQPIKTNGSDVTYLGSLYAEALTSGAGPNGTYTYKVSCHATTQAIELNQVSNSVTVANKDVALSMIPISPDTINGEDIVYRKVYRNSVAAPTTWNLLTNGKISDNTTTTLTDSDTDAALGEAYSAGGGATEETWTPPKGKLYLIHKNRLWVANDSDHPSRIYYSDDGSHDMFDPLAYYDIRSNDGDEITFAKNLLGILAIGKTNSIQKLFTEGDDPSADWSVSDPIVSIGCDAIYSAVNTPIGIMYLSRANEGIYVFNGQSAILKSEKITPTIKDISSNNLGSVWGEYNNSLYYLAYPSKESGTSINNRLLVYDLLSDAFSIDLVSLNCLSTFKSSYDAGDLYAGSSTSGKIFSFSTSALSVVHNKHSDFTDSHPAAWSHARYIPVAQGGDSNSPEIEIAWTDTVNSIQDTINGLVGKIDRQRGNGSYISPIINTAGASSYDKFFWNATLPASTHVQSHVSVAIRGGNSHTECLAASWSAEYNTSSGSDISALTAYPYTQYRLSLGANLEIDQAPEVNTLGGYTVKLVYNKVGSAAESSIALHWQTGYFDFGAPGYKKALRKIIVYLEGTDGTLDISFTNEYGESDSFAIDVATHSTMYSEYFTNGAFLGTKFKMDIQNDDINAIKVKDIVLVMDVEPII